MRDFGAILETGGAAAVELAASAVAERGAKPGACASCKAPLTGPYCAACGQPRNVHRRAIHHLVGDVIGDVVNFDSRILRTIVALLLIPGELPLAYREGRTQPYVPPVRLYLFISLIFFLALSAAHIALFQFGMNLTPQTWVKDGAGQVYLENGGKRTLMPNFTAGPDGRVMVIGQPVGSTRLGDVTYTVSAPPIVLRRIDQAPPIPASVRDKLQAVEKELDARNDNSLRARAQHAISLTLSKLEKDPAALNDPMTEWLPRLLFVLLPLFALALALFYRDEDEDIFFVDHLVFSLNYHSFGFALLLLALGPAQFIGQGTLIAVLFGAMALYLLLAMKRFYGQGWGLTMLKFLGFGIIYSLFILGPAFAGLLTVSVINA